MAVFTRELLLRIPIGIWEEILHARVCSVLLLSLHLFLFTTHTGMFTYCQMRECFDRVNVTCLEMPISRTASDD